MGNLGVHRFRWFDKSLSESSVSVASPGGSEPIDNLIPSHCVKHLAGKRRNSKHPTFDKVWQVITLEAIVLEVRSMEAILVVTL